METWRYVGAALAAGLVAVFASENLFWSAPRPDFWLPGWFLTWGLYAACAGVALSAVAFTGCGGWRGLFLGGAILGFMVEGVAVDTMYDAFPVQVVWTPLAWHALITALAVGGLGRVAGVWPVWRLAAGWVALGLMFGAWALYWPTERDDVPSVGLLFVYLCVLGLALPVGQWGLSRPGRVPRPHGAVLVVLPVLFAVVWGVKAVMAPSPVKLALPVMAGLTVWAMGRLGDRGVVSLGSAPVGRQVLSLIAPGVAFVVIVLAWGVGGGLPTNIAVAVVSGVVSVGLWVWLLWRAVRRSA